METTNTTKTSSENGNHKLNHHAAKHRTSNSDDEKALMDVFAQPEENRQAEAEEIEPEEEEEKESEKQKKERQRARAEFNESMKTQGLTRLKFLLEKTSLYSQFLAQKVQLPTQVATTTTPQSESKEEDAEIKNNNKSDTPTSNGKTKKRRQTPTKKASPAKRATRSTRSSKKQQVDDDEEADDGDDAEEKQNDNEEEEEEQSTTNNKSQKNNNNNDFGAVNIPVRAQPELITGGEMRSYQLQGVEWLVSLYENGLNGILADEMGLGKTVQCLGLLAHLVQNGVNGPFMIVAPLSTLSNWMREVDRWCPSITALMYHGTKDERAAIRAKHFNKRGKQFPSIIVTSYQISMRDRKYLQKFQWKYIVVDEGHRIKNLNCKLVQELKSIQSANRLLLTGTPLQNNLNELWSMLNFLLPDIFDDLQSFQDWFDFSEIGQQEGKEKIIAQEEQNQIVTKLHQILRPFLLRRIKEDVELDLPTKHEKIAFSHLSELQKKYYKAILTKQLSTVISEESQKQILNRGSSLQNTLMQLRKCCNHPYLFEWPVDKDGEDIIDESLVTSSGKLQMLDRILPRLFKEGHRVLIFSQMARMLDILEDYLTMREWIYYRIDGTTPQPEREEQINNFNTKPDAHCFLLSTRAGGLGINLTAADTVIFYDNDWNPQMDLQAQDRVHRIGQTKPVKVYRFATANSIESSILERAENKMQLERLVIQTGNFKGVRSKSFISSLNELEELLTREEKYSNAAGVLDEQVTDQMLFSWSDKERTK